MIQCRNIISPFRGKLLPSRLVLYESCPRHIFIFHYLKTACKTLLKPPFGKPKKCVLFSSFLPHFLSLLPSNVCYDLSLITLFPHLLATLGVDVHPLSSPLPSACPQLSSAYPRALYPHHLLRLVLFTLRTVIGHGGLGVELCRPAPLRFPSSSYQPLRTPILIPPLLVPLSSSSVSLASLGGGSLRA